MSSNMWKKYQKTHIIGFQKRKRLLLLSWNGTAKNTLQQSHLKKFLIRTCSLSLSVIFLKKLSTKNYFTMPARKSKGLILPLIDTNLFLKESIWWWNKSKETKQSRWLTKVILIVLRLLLQKKIYFINSTKRTTYLVHKTCLIWSKSMA